MIVTGLLIDKKISQIKTEIAQHSTVIPENTTHLGYLLLELLNFCRLEN